MLFCLIPSFCRAATRWSNSPGIGVKGSGWRQGKQLYPSEKKEKTSAEKTSAPHKHPLTTRVLIFRIKWYFDSFLHNKCICREKRAYFILWKEERFLGLSNAALTRNNTQARFESYLRNQTQTPWSRVERGRLQHPPPGHLCLLLTQVRGRGEPSEAAQTPPNSLLPRASDGER